MRTPLWTLCVAVLLAFTLQKGSAASDTESPFRIVVNFTTAELLFFENKNLRSVHPVVLPRITPQLPVTGITKKIIVGAWWYPTERTRNAYLRKYGKELPKRIPPGSELNAMGAGKIIIQFTSGKINPTVRIHGTNDPSLLGQRISRGCIRLRNEDFLAIAGRIGKGEATVLFVQ